MSSKFSLLSSAMPTFTKKTTVEARVDALTDYQVQLLEYLRYALSNLDADNFNASGLNEILEPVVAEIKNTEGDILTLKMTAKELEATVKGYDSQLGEMQSKITQTSDKISAVVSAVDDSSGNVTAASIVAAINAAGSSVQISADHIQLVGDYVTVTDLQTGGAVVIDAGNISAGTISGVRLVSSDYGDGEFTDPLRLYTVTIDGGSILFDNDISMAAMFGTLFIKSSGYNGCLSIEVGGTVWEFFSDGLYKDGTRVVY